MATPVPLQFAKHSYQARSGNANVQQLLNLYPEANPEESKGPVTLYGTPGLKLWTTVGDGPIRGMHLMGSYLYVVTGNELYVVESNKIATLVGSVGGIGAVRMTDSGVHVLIATSAPAYAADTDEIFHLQEGNFNGVTYQDGYGIFTRKNSQDFYVTNLDDMTVITATDVSQADSSSSFNRGCISNHRDLWVFQEKTIEIFNNVGNADFPFTRAGSGFIERGCYSPNSIAEEDRSIFWLGDDRGVYMSHGYQPARISTPPIEKLIGEQTDAEASVGFTYRQEGHVFYCLSFAKLTVCYDKITGRWHERETHGDTRWLANNHQFAFEKNLVGDYDSGRIYELDLATYQDNSGTIIRRAVSQAMHGNGSKLWFPQVYADFETGVGIATGQGSSPTAMLDWTDDFGASWSSQMTAGIGASGDQSARVNFHRLGSSRHRFFRLEVSDPVKVAITGAYARIEGFSQ